mmetsp:Transcript_29750/g.83836  ORF Transcript_29750/g.83836 Transcript_29750/m.83836 type:complete len:209 (-) Transcript_29750:865-1491(-)
MGYSHGFGAGRGLCGASYCLLAIAAGWRDETRGCEPLEAPLHSESRCFLHQRRQVSAHKAGCPLADGLEVHVSRQPKLPCLDLQDLFTCRLGRNADRYLPVKSACSPESRVQGIRAIGGSKHHHMLARDNFSHFVFVVDPLLRSSSSTVFSFGSLNRSRRLAEVIHAGEHLGHDPVLHLPLSRLSLGSNGVDLVYEDNTWRQVCSLPE